jgi:KRI1-like family
MEKLRKAEFVTGSTLSGEGSGLQGNVRLLEKIEKELKTDFIPELYDRAMEKMFDDKYYATEDKEAEKMAGARDLNIKLMKDEELPSEPEGAEEEDKQSDIEQYERELAQPLKKQLAKKIEREEATGAYETWFACDGCQKPIGGGEYRFDCVTCDNFCFCEKCYRKNK